MKSLVMYLSIVVILTAGMSAAESCLDGMGTEEEPYMIRSISDFMVFADRANAVQYWASGVYIRLETNLDLEGIDFEPIGGTYDDGEGNSIDLSFDGTFDGNGHMIANASIERMGQDYVGLFGRIGTEGTVYRLGVVNGRFWGHNYIGGLAGYNEGTIEACYTSGQAAGSYAGGVAGYCANRITSCYSESTVNGGVFVGGLAGYCLFATIQSSYSAGLVGGESFAGGLVGWAFSSTVLFCYWDVDTSQQQYSTGGTGKTTAEMKKQSTYSEWDFAGTWWMPAEGYPRLQSSARYVGAGTEAEPYQIRSAEDWRTLMRVAGDWNKHFIVTADLDFSGMVLTPVAPDMVASMDYQFEGTPFTGVVDGQGHTLRHIVISLPDEDFVGLFGAIGAGGRVENLRVEAISVQGRLSVGALAGLNQGTIAGCRSEGVVEGEIGRASCRERV